MQQWIGKVIVFNNAIEEKESYPEGSMRARILSIHRDNIASSDLMEHVYRIVFDYSEYEDFNRLLETANYYGTDGIPNKTAQEAGHYQAVETVYFGSPELDPFENYFQLASKKHSKLREQFIASGENNYVEWLENQVQIQ